MTQPEASMITEEHRASIGRKTTPIPITISEADAHRMRDVLQDSDPRYRDGTGVAAPYVISALDPGLPAGLLPRILPGTLLTQAEWRFERPLRIGEPLQAVSQVVDIRDRLGGRYGYSVLVMIGTDFLDAAGGTVCSSIKTVTQFDPKGARPE